MADNSYGCPKHEEHERRLNELREAVDEVRDKVNKLDKEDGIRDEHYNMITKQLISSNKELSDTMKAVAKTMVDMREEMAGTNAKMESFTTKMDDLEANVGAVREKINDFEKKDSISILDIIKKNAVGIVLAIGAIIYYLTEKGVL